MRTILVEALSLTHVRLSADPVTAGCSSSGTEEGKTH
jgi:hypothetical protein